MTFREALSTFRGHRVPHVDIIGRWRWWFGLSGLFIVLSLVGLFARGLNYSIDFKGGSLLSFPDRSGGSVGQFQAIMSRFGLPDSEVEIIGAGTVNIRSKSLTSLGVIGSPTTTAPSNAASATPSTQASATPSAAPSASTAPSATPTPSAAASPTTAPGVLPTFKGDQLRAALARAAGIGLNEINEDDVGPTWGHTITQKALVGLIFFLILVTVYITVRFELKMAGGALAALAHDLIITAGVYALVGREVTPETVIAILTILGYSLYDTVVIYDKVKENTEQASLVARDGYSAVVNMSLNQTLMRSVNTSLVVLLPIGALLAFGGQTLKDFAFALFVGVASGTYSSIFIAAPLLALLKEREPRYQDIRRRAMARAARPGLRTVPAQGAATSGGGGRRRVEGAAAAEDGESLSEARSVTVRTRPTATTATKKKKGKPQGKPKRRRR